MSKTLAAAAPELDLPAMSIPNLIDHILMRYHEPHRQELPAIIALARKVERVHHDVPEVPQGLADALEQLSKELDEHMKKEELVLFPIMRGTIQHAIRDPIEIMRGDHENHAGIVRQLKELTEGFAVPEGACTSWQSLYVAAEKLCADLLEHIHVENDILFPRFELAARSGCICSHG
jgi:regulator of cell morphogenesis and NO signaling